MAKVQVEIPPNVSFHDGQAVRRAGEMFEVERDEHIDALVRHGSLKVVPRRSTRPTVRRGGERAEVTTRRAKEKR